MSSENGDVDPALARAIGLVVLGEASAGEAAAATGVSRWAVDAAIEEAGIAESLGLDGRDIGTEIDALLDPDS